MEEKNYEKALILSNAILEHYPTNKLVQELNKYIKLQIGQPEDNVPITEAELEEAEHFNPFEAEQYSDFSEEEEEEETEEESSQDKFEKNSNQKSQSIQKKVLSKQRPLSRGASQKPSVIKPKPLNVKISIKNFPNNKK